MWDRVRGAASSAWAVLTGSARGADALPTAERRDRYAYLWAWETGTVFTGSDPRRPAVLLWAETLKSTLHLYRHTRLVWNPVPDLTDFWGSVVYPGVLTRTGLPGRNDTPSAIPFEVDTPPALIKAATQIWWWSNMPALKYVIPHWAAVAGNMLLQLVDDVPGRKIVLQPWTAEYVPEIALNAAGDVIAYTLEYEVAADGERPAYTYRLEVDRAESRTFRDGTPTDFSGDQALGARWPNPWGFVPACWVPHQPTGTPYGAPAVGAALGELLEINSLQAMLDDAVARATKPIPWFATDSAVSQLFPNTKQGPTAELDDPEAGRESLLAFKLAADARVGKLDPSADTAAVAAYLTTRKTEWLRHFPEVSMWESLRAQTQVSGVAAEILHGDTRNKAVAIRAVTDRQVEKATQMAITMAGVRLATTWRDTDARHEVFRPYDRTSFGAGALDFNIAERPLVPAAPLTATERAALADVRLNKLGLPEAWVWEEAGVPAAVIKAAQAAPPPPPPVTPPAAAGQVEQVPPGVAPMMAPTGTTGGTNATDSSRRAAQ